MVSCYCCFGVLETNKEDRDLYAVTYSCQGQGLKSLEWEPNPLYNYLLRVLIYNLMSASFTRRLLRTPRGSYAFVSKADRVLRASHRFPDPRSLPGSPLRTPSPSRPVLRSCLLCTRYLPLPCTKEIHTTFPVVVRMSLRETRHSDCDME